MKLNAVGVTSTNISKTIEFYKILGFEFHEYLNDEEHVESITEEGATKLMIDSEEMTQSIIGEKPVPSNHSTFALEFETTEELNQVAKNVTDAGFKVVKEPWDAFWGQRYAIVEDPNGYKVDLYSPLK